jgi:hypothetical protein
MLIPSRERAFPMYNISGELCPLIIGLMITYPYPHTCTFKISFCIYFNLKIYTISKLGSEYIALNFGDWVIILTGLTRPSVSKLVGAEGGWFGISSLLIVALLEEFFLIKSTLMYGGSFEYGCNSPVIL